MNCKGGSKSAAVVTVWFLVLILGALDLVTTTWGALTILDEHRIHNWYGCMRIRNDFLPGWEAVELYPCKERSTDEGNYYHLWARKTP